MPRTQLRFFMKPDRLSALMHEFLKDWEDTIVVEEPKFPQAFTVVNQVELCKSLSTQEIHRFFLSVAGAPTNSKDLSYQSRNPGHHVAVTVGRVDPTARRITPSQATVDRTAEPALSLLGKLRESVRAVSHDGIVGVSRTGKEITKRESYWTPDLTDWDLSGHRPLIPETRQ